MITILKLILALSSLYLFTVMAVRIYTFAKRFWTVYKSVSSIFKNRQQFQKAKTSKTESGAMTRCNYCNLFVLKDAAFYMNDKAYCSKEHLELDNP